MEKRTTTIEAELAAGRVVLYPNVGVSMMPLLRQGKDLMILAPRPKGRLNKYDAALFKRGDQLVLHRVLQVRPNDYLIVGDNCIQKEYVKEEQIIGVMTGVVRGGKTVQVTDWRYLCYVHLWCDFFPLRAFLLRCRGRLGGAKRRLKKLLRR